MLDVCISKRKARERIYKRRSEREKHLFIALNSQIDGIVCFYKVLTNFYVITFLKFEHKFVLKYVFLNKLEYIKNIF